MPETRQPRDGMIEQHEQLPAQHRAASVRADTVNEEARTAELVFSTGAVVRRFSWARWEEVDEELVISANAVDLARMNNGAPLLDTHNMWRLQGVVGVVERAWIAAGEARAIVRFSERDDVGPIFRDVAGGIIRNVSVGYRVQRFEIEERDGQRPLYRAVEWEPMEISLVPVGADAGAGVRAEMPAPAHPVVLLRHGGNAMDDNTRTEATVVNVAETVETPRPVVVDTDAVERTAATAERNRIRQIERLARATGYPAEDAKKLVDGEVALDDAMRRINEWQVAADEATPTRSAHSATIVDDTVDRFHRGAEQALLLRSGMRARGDGELADEFTGMTLRELAREYLVRHNVDTRGLGGMDLAGRALTFRAPHAIGDFPLILGNVANKAMMRGYEEAGETFQIWTSVGVLTDFKVADRVDLNAFPSLAVVPEGAEYTYATMGERREQVQLATYGRMFSITRQALINDDLMAFTRIPQRMGRAAIRTVGNLAYAVITANAAMADGTALFHADHSNLAGSGGAPTVASIDTGRAAMATQTDRGSSAVALNIRPAYVLVPVVLQGTVQVLMESEFDPAKTQRVPNHVRGLAGVVADARLDTDSTTAWYLAANPAQTDTVEVSYLEGNQAPVLERQPGFTVDGVEFKVRIDAAVKALAWEGLYKNAGA